MAVAKRNLWWKNKYQQNMIDTSMTAIIGFEEKKASTLNKNFGVGVRGIFMNEAPIINAQI